VKKKSEFRSQNSEDPLTLTLSPQYGGEGRRGSKSFIGKWRNYQRPKRMKPWGKKAAPLKWPP
jgi:hypothetical protein